MRFPEYLPPEMPEKPGEPRVPRPGESGAIRRFNPQGEGREEGWAWFAPNPGPEDAAKNPPLALDPDRDTWVSQIIPARICWQYGPSGQRVPFLRQSTPRGSSER